MRCRRSRRPSGGWWTRTARTRPTRSPGLSATLTRLGAPPPAGGTARASRFATSPLVRLGPFARNRLRRPRLMTSSVRAQTSVGVCRYEDLRVWQAAKRQCDRVGKLIKRPKFRRDPGLSSQLSDASISVIADISEGFLRQCDKEFMRPLRYSAASYGEVKAYSTPRMTESTLTRRS